jgi:hypothetical protein
MPEDQQKDTPTLRSFNPTNNPHVDEIKRRTDELIAYVQENVVEGRRRSVAITNYEQAAMWAVKAVFHR